MVVIRSNVGVMSGLIVTLNVVGEPHSSSSGVNVYSVVPGSAVLIAAGLHVPLMLLDDVDGRMGAVEFWQSGSISSKSDVTWSAMVMLKVTSIPHCPSSGVKV